MSPIAEIALGAAAGGGLQLISEVSKLVGGMIATQRDMALAASTSRRADMEAADRARNHAAGRSAPWLRAALGLLIIVAAFWLSFAAGLLDMPTSIVTESESTSLLWGLIDFGNSGVDVVEAQGFVMGPDFWSSVRAVVGFVFGVGAVSTGRRIF
jgi:hypothetical protein